MAQVSLFQMITDKLLKKIRFQASEYDFYYTQDDEEYKLNSEEIDDSMINYKIVDNEGIWTPDDYNFCIRRTYSLRTYQCLFGKDGIACRNSVLGLALIWTSADSKQRGVVKIGDIKNIQDDLKLSLNYEFKKAQLRGNIELTTVIYIEQSGTPLHNEEHLANTYGYILGKLDKYFIKLDGTGSVFPIYEENLSGQPLWYVRCEWEDPTYDKLSECVSIVINTANKNYKYLDRSKRTFNKELLKEIIASAICIIITKLKEDNYYWETTIMGDDLQNGSVSQAVNYFIKVLGWSVQSPESMSLSIRKFLDQRM